MSEILDGRKVREEKMAKLIERREKLLRVPKLAIIQVGDRPDSTAFIKAKQSFAKKIGVGEVHIQLMEPVKNEQEVIQVIKKCNQDADITGIIVQLPLPANLNRDLVIEAIDPKKDADGLTSATTIMPATARGIRELLAFYKIKLTGKKVTVIGRSVLVGTPIAAMCRQEGATVRVCHSQTSDLQADTNWADVVISATGKIGLVRAEHIQKGAIVVDVGISRKADGKLTGDVDFESVSQKAAAISPVPGGVGPMTVCALFENLLDLAGN